MANDPNKFYHELKAHLESFRQQKPLPNRVLKNWGLCT